MTQLPGFNLIQYQEMQPKVYYDPIGDLIVLVEGYFPKHSWVTNIDMDDKTIYCTSGVQWHYITETELGEWVCVREDSPESYGLELLGDL